MGSTPRWADREPVGAGQRTAGGEAWRRTGGRTNIGAGGREVDNYRPAGGRSRAG